MAFEKGKARPARAGRKAGTPNKLKLLSVRQSLANAGFDVAAEIKKLLADPALTTAERFEVLKWLAEVHPIPPPSTDEEADSQPQDEATLLAIAAD